MREISLYKMEPVYVVGETENIQKLREKLRNDLVILNEIQNDFERDNKSYQREYLNAKSVYLRNERFLNWLILKHYYDIAYAFNSESIFDKNYQKIEMEEKGWVLPLRCSNIQLSGTGLFAGTVETRYINLFDFYFDDLFNIVLNIGDINTNKFYRQAISNYKNTNYFSCAVTLFPIIESLHKAITNYNFDGFYKIKEHLKDFSETVNNITNVFSVDINYFKNVANLINNLIEKHYFIKSVDRKKEPEIINRNRLMHGLFTRDVSQKDCLQLFCVISNLDLLQNLINASNKLESIGKEIEELSKSLE